MNGERDREIASYTTETVSSIYSYVFPLLATLAGALYQRACVLLIPHSTHHIPQAERKRDDMGWEGEGRGGVDRVSVSVICFSLVGRGLGLQLRVGSGLGLGVSCPGGGPAPRQAGLG